MACLVYKNSNCFVKVKQLQQSFSKICKMGLTFFMFYHNKDASTYVQEHFWFIIPR